MLLGINWDKICALQSIARPYPILYAAQSEIANDMFLDFFLAIINWISIPGLGVCLTYNYLNKNYFNFNGYWIS